MAKGDNIIMKRRLANAYVSSVISISLVLLLVGIASLLLVNARSVSDYFKENMQISVLLKEEVGEERAQKYLEELSSQHYIKTAEYISREQGIQEMKDLLGDDFLSVFETPPIPISINVTLQADYVSSDSLEVVGAKIQESPLVDELVYQRSLVDALNANLSKISLVLGIFIILLMFISFVLINNTVRLNVYARRFTIHTMRLVGATRAFIRRPFIIEAVMQGVFAALISIMMLIGLLFVIKNEFIELFQVFQLELLLLVMGIVLVTGVLICLLSTFLVVNKLISYKRAELYY